MSPTFDHDGIAFSYIDEGAGPPLVFQHGLGGDASQPRFLWGGLGRLICMECRAHGHTTPVGPETDLNFRTFAADLAALLDHLAVDTAALAGVSMGAGIALRLAYEQPQRVTSLVLVRPAWFTTGAPPNLRGFQEISQLLRDHGSNEGLEIFEQSDIYREMLAISAGAAESLVGQFDRDGAVERAAVLDRIPRDRPLPADEPWPELKMRTLIIGTSDDPLHPLTCALAWADALPDATFRQVTSRYADAPRHAREVAIAMNEFLS